MTSRKTLERWGVASGSLAYGIGILDDLRDGVGLLEPGVFVVQDLEEQRIKQL